MAPQPAASGTGRILWLFRHIVILGHRTPGCLLFPGVFGDHAGTPPAPRLHHLRQGRPVVAQVLGHANPGTVAAEAIAEVGMDCRLAYTAADGPVGNAEHQVLVAGVRGPDCLQVGAGLGSDQLQGPLSHLVCLGPVHGDEPDPSPQLHVAPPARWASSEGRHLSSYPGNIRASQLHQFNYSALLSKKSLPHLLSANYSCT